LHPLQDRTIAPRSASTTETEVDEEMLPYSDDEAKGWARDSMRGVCNVVMPTFTSDLKRLNEEAIRHDVRRSIELGFWGGLAVSECGTTFDEYVRFVEIAVDEAAGRYHVVHHASFDTLEDTIAAGKAAAAAGATVQLLSYAQSFYPTSDEEVEEYTRRVLDEVPLATVLFAVHLWNYQRLHPAELSPTLIDRLSHHPLVVAVKCEGGGTGNGAHVEVLERSGERLLVSDPREGTAPGHVKWFGMQWMGTSNFQYFGDAVPRYFDLMHKGEWDEAMEIYWRIHPARTARLADLASNAGSHFIHRQSWKYQEWLNGFNGGPLRMPTMRLNDAATGRLAAAAVKSGIIDEVPGTLVDFFAGRNPA
jgi:dihydrodipicolinate synthase/N-acetylneuraminate lyase